MGRPEVDVIYNGLSVCFAHYIWKRRGHYWLYTY